MLRPGLGAPAALAALMALGGNPACGRVPERDDGSSAPAPGACVTPRLVLTDTGAFLDLTPGMRRALAAYAPAFTPWRRADYDAEVLAHFAPDGLHPPFGVVGDFDGNGACDAALQGYTERYELFVVLLAAGDSARVIELERRALYFAPRGLKRDIYLRAVAAGEPIELSPEVGERPPKPEHDAFMQVFEGQAAVLYYWNGERFITYVIGD